MQEHPQLMKPVMCFSALSAGLTADTIEELFRPQLSPAGSNVRTVENKVYAWFLDYIQAVQGK
jgi:hypothetical protein